MPHELAEILRELTQLPPHESTDPQLQAEQAAAAGISASPVACRVDQRSGAARVRPRSRSDQRCGRRSAQLRCAA